MTSLHKKLLKLLKEDRYYIPDDEFLDVVGKTLAGRSFNDPLNLWWRTSRMEQLRGFNFREKKQHAANANYLNSFGVDVGDLISMDW